ncbi:MAG: ABC transporter permease [Candidimonas sp.]|nr:MAG: ABC transporter permease [Candidimonas sp.]
MRLTRHSTVGIFTVLVLCVIWYFAAGPFEWVDLARFPDPDQTWEALAQISVSGYADATLLQHAAHSSWLVLMGFASAVAVGVPLGIAMGYSRRIEALVNPVFLLIRPIPPLAWIPLAIVWLGLGDAAKVMVIWFAAFVPAVINCYTGVRSIDEYLLEASDVLGIRRYAFFAEVVIPATLPAMFTGLRLSLQASWTTLVAAELIGAVAGLGHVLTQASLDIYPAMILVAMVAVAVCGGLMTAVLDLIEKWAMPWWEKS